MKYFSENTYKKRNTMAIVAIANQIDIQRKYLAKNVKSAQQ
jgi:hypothetical protein